MTSFVHVEQPVAHPGVARAEAAIAQFSAATRRVDGTRGLAALLLAAVISGALLVADRLVANEGSLLVLWATLWVVAFVAIALFSGVARSVAARAITGFEAYARRRATAQADERFLAYAKYDTRIMQELQAAASRQEAVEGVASPATAAARRTADSAVPTLYEAMRRVNLGKYY
ncbi:hypothetical protein BH10PSE18_BH10PSE18_28950 [soil metagenome]